MKGVFKKIYKALDHKSVILSTSLSGIVINIHVEPIIQI